MSGRIPTSYSTHALLLVGYFFFDKKILNMQAFQRVFYIKNLKFKSKTLYTH